MSQSLANIIVHLVFSTKRRRLLRDEEHGQLHAYIRFRWVCRALSGRENLFGDVDLGLRALRFTPGYHMTGFQPSKDHAFE